MPEDVSAQVEVVGRTGSLLSALGALGADHGAGVVVVDGDLDLLERVAETRSAGHRVVWSVDREPSADVAVRAGELADGTRVASSRGSRAGRGCGRGWCITAAVAAATPEPRAAPPAPPWPPDSSAWADRVVQVAQILAPPRPEPPLGPAPISWTAAAAAAAAVAAAAPIAAPRRSLRS